MNLELDTALNKLPFYTSGSRIVPGELIQVASHKDREGRSSKAFASSVEYTVGDDLHRRCDVGRYGINHKKKYTG